MGSPAAFQASGSETAGWFRRLVGSASPSRVSVNVNVDAGAASALEVPMGPVGKDFAGVARIVAERDNSSLLRAYLQHLSKLRTRFNQISNQGDPGPGARLLMQQTLDGNGSELADALKYVDEQMLTGMDAATFEKTASDANGKCPVSNALRGSLSIEVVARTS